MTEKRKIENYKKLISKMDEEINEYKNIIKEQDEEINRLKDRMEQIEEYENLLTQREMELNQFIEDAKDIKNHYQYLVNVLKTNVKKQPKVYKNIEKIIKKTM